MPSLTRFIQYYRTHGLGKVLRRIPEKIWVDYFCRSHILYATDLYEAEIEAPEFPPELGLVRRDSLDEVTPLEYRTLVYYRGEKEVRSQCKKRFDRGAKLWILNRSGKPIGVIWSISGKTIEPHFFCLTPNDIHIFDNEIFQEFRGQGFNQFLMLTVFKKLQEDGNYRVHGETKVKNIAKRQSNEKMPFRVPYAIASKLHLFGRTVVFWRPLDLPN